MVAQLIGSIVLVGVIFLFYKVGKGFLEDENLLSKFFPIGSSLLGVFLLSLIWLS
jgi:uncharacterized membrane protein